MMAIFLSIYKSRYIANYICIFYFINLSILDYSTGLKKHRVMASQHTRRGIGKEKDLLTKKSILPGSSMKLVFMARSVH